jgi:cytidylate kinase
MAIITISRGTMSGGGALANSLSLKLGLPAISREILLEAAGRFGISSTLLEQQLEKTKGLISGPSPERHLYLTAIQLALAEKAAQGGFIYYGHAGHLLLKGVPRVLKIRVVAPLDRRARKLAEDRNLPLEEAKRKIEKMDEGRIKWTRFLYGVDWRDPELYDLVVNLDAITIAGAGDIIGCALSQPEFAESPDSKKIIEDFVLASRVKHALATHDTTKGLELEVRAERGTITINGSFETGGIFPSGKKRIQNDLTVVAQQIQGVQKVQIGLEDIPVALE